MYARLLITACLFLLHAPSIDSTTEFLGATPNGTSVYGIAVANSLLHVIRSDVKTVQVYHPPSQQLTQLQSLELINKTGFFDMAYLPKANLLALLNWFDGQNVMLMSLDPPYNIFKWNFTTVDSVSALSVTHNDELIIITESASKSLKVFTKDGELIRHIKLKTNMSPRHAVRTEDNLYAVTFGYGRKEPHYVCKFNVLGFVVGMCFGGRPGNSLRQLDVPARLVETQSGLLVSDMGNKRILEIKKDMSQARLVLDRPLNHPYRILYTPEDETLYVADNFLDPVTKYSVGGRVLAFKYKPETTWLLVERFRGGGV